VIKIFIGCSFVFHFFAALSALGLFMALYYILFGGVTYGRLYEILLGISLSGIIAYFFYYIINIK